MVWILVAVLLFAVALIAIKLSQINHDLELELEDDVDDVDPIIERNKKIPAFINTYINHIGLVLSPTAVWSLLALLFLLGIVLMLTQPMNIALIGIIASLLVVNLVLKSAGAKRKAHMLQQLPSFLNQVSRRLASGVSVEHAFTDSVESLEDPLAAAVKRTMQRTAMGMELHQAFEREARTSDVEQFHIVATAMRINEQFGGSIRSILDDIVEILNLDDLGKRELRAQTGETRITAVVLSLLPIAIAGWLVLQNPDFLDNMWKDDTGQFLLILAGVMQVSGVITLWRMVKSI